MAIGALIEPLFSHLPFFLALVVRPSPYRKLFFIPILCANIWILLYGSSPVNYSRVVNIWGTSLVTRVAIASDFILLTDVQNELRLQNDKRHISSAPLRERMSWGFRLMTTSRGIGWAHECTTRFPPKPQNISRWAFVVSKLLWAGYYYILSDLEKIPLQWNFAVIRGEVGMEGLTGLFARATFLVYLAEVYTGMNMAYNILAAVTVSVGLSEPRDWPAIFGYWSDAYTVGRFWGRFWHQNFRRFVTAHGKFISKNIFHLKSGTSLAWHVQLFVAFALSGLIHLAGDYRGQDDWTKGGTMRFFLLQAVAISFEDVVINLASRLGFGKTTRLSKCIGYLWVLGWWIWAVPPWTGPWAEVRIREVGHHRQSFILRVCQQVLGDSEGSRLL